MTDCRDIPIPPRLEPTDKRYDNWLDGDERHMGAIAPDGVTRLTMRQYEQMRQWADNHGGPGHTLRQVGADEIGDTFVSTVWLGYNHAFGNGPPLIFETMIFGPKADGDCWRYSTFDAALAGHDRVTAWVREGMPKEAAPE